MKFVYYGLIVAFTIFLTACGSQKDSKNILKVGLQPFYPPFESVAPSGEFEGFDIDFSKALAQKLGKELVMEEFGFDALILALQQGKIDLVISALSISESRQKEIAMIPYQGEPLKEFKLLFWKKPTEASSLQELEQIVVMTGSTQDHYLQKLSGVKMKSLETTMEMVMDVQYGKSIAALFEPAVAKRLEAQFPEIVCVNHPLPKEHWVLGYGIGVKKENSELIQKVQEAVSALKAEGTIAELEKKWKLKDEE